MPTGERVFCQQEVAKWRWGSSKERSADSPIAHRERMRGRSLCVGGLEDAESEAGHLRPVAESDGGREREGRSDGVFGCGERSATSCCMPAGKVYAPPISTV